MTEIKYYKRIFVTPSVVYYPEDKKQMVYLPKEVLDNSYTSIVGTPVFITHDGSEPVGEVVDAYYSPEKAAYIAGFNVWDAEAQRLLDDKNYSISCVYKIIDYDGAGTHNNIAYDERVNDMKFTSLAIVDKPRFEQAQEKLNSINNNSKDNMLKNRLNAESDEDYITFRGKQISFEDLGRVLMEEAAFHKGAPVADREAEENPGRENDLEEKKVFVKEYPEDEEIEEREYFDNKRCNAEEDKRKIIDEIGGILKGKVDEEIWRTVIQKVEQLSYNDSERSKDNALEDDKVDERKLRRDGEDRIKADLKDERKNSLALDRAYKRSYTGQSLTRGYMSRAERIARDTKKYLN